MRLNFRGKENCLRGGRGKAKPRYARAIRSMQRVQCKGKKKAPHEMRIFLQDAVSFTLAAFNLEKPCKFCHPVSPQ
jgi:hypothetical protein